MSYRHADLMLQYARDAAEMNEPWLRWEWKFRDNDTWYALDGPSSFCEALDYRRKPETIMVNGIEVEAPLGINDQSAKYIVKITVLATNTKQTLSETTIRHATYNGALDHALAMASARAVK